MGVEFFHPDLYNCIIMRRTRKKESFFSKTFNFLLTLSIACLIGNQVIGAQGYSLKFAQISDAHIATGYSNTSYKLLENSKELLADAVLQANKEENLDFVIFSGDMIDRPNSSQLMEFISIAKNLKTPWWVAIGNHDVDFDGKFTKKDLYRIINAHNLHFNSDKPYYTFSPKKGFKVIVLDSTITSRVTANGEIPTEQLDWLDKEIRDTSDKDVVIICSHAPVIEPFQSEHHEILNKNEVLKYVYSYNRPIIWIAGHYHGTKVIQDGNKLFINSPALITYPNAFRILNINSQKDKVLVDIYTKETTLKDIQRRAKIRTLFADMLYGEEKDRNGTYELSK